MWIHKLGDEFDVASTLRTVVVVVSLLAGDFTSAAQYRVNYAVLEGQPVSTFVGELLRDGNFTGGPRPTFLVRRRHRPSPLLFSVDRRSGAVRTAVVLDREGLCPPDPDWGDSGVADESRCIVSFEVRAIATLTHTVRVDVEVLDLNDNAPAFPDSQVTVNVVETAAVGSLFPLPDASDADSRQYGVREYQLRSDATPPPPFDIKVTDVGGRVKDVRLRLTGRVDREQTASYDLTVVALDGGRPARSAELTVHAVVVDANDNLPTFDHVEYLVQVREDVAPGAELVRVHADDPDDGPRGRVKYAFSAHVQRAYGDLFRVDGDSGAIYLRTALDYEKSTSYHLTVTATDLGTPPSLPVSAKVTIVLEDVNDNSPNIIVNVLTASGSAEVRENVDEAGTFVAHLSAHDADSGAYGRVECQLSDGGAHLFRLESLYDDSDASATAEYKIVTTAKVDREERAEYHLVVTCRDADQVSSRLESSREIVVAVLDENDHAPQFAQSEFNVSVAENGPPGTELYRVNASDADFGPNAEISYRMRSLDGTGEGLLSVHPTSGVVSAQVSLNYENSPRELVFEVTATDGGEPPQSASATLRLFVKDTNDQRPRFERLSYFFNVSENSPPGTSVGSVVAVDPDASPRFARVVYRIRRQTGSSSGSGTGNDAFEVDSESGKLRTVRRLDRERRSVYVFTVVASNDVGYDVTMTSRRRGDRPEVDMADVTVYVDDVNDNEPKFVFPGRERGNIAYLATSLVNRAGSLVTRLEAVDADSGLNSDLLYDIPSGNEDSAFDVDRATGIVTVADGGALARRASRLHRLIVVVRDRGTPSLQTVADLTVAVNDSVIVAPLDGEVQRQGGLDVTVAVAGGAAVGGALVITCIVLVAVVVCCLRRRRSKRRRRTEELDKHRSRSSLARASSVGGASSCCRHHPLCQSATRLSGVGCYVHEPCPGDDGSLSTAPGGRRGSVGSSTSSVSDCSGSRQATLCHCDDLETADDEEGTQSPADSTTAPATSSTRVCVVQGLLRANGDSGLAAEARSPVGVGGSRLGGSASSDLPFDAQSRRVHGARCQHGSTTALVPRDHCCCGGHAPAVRHRRTHHHQHHRHPHRRRRRTPSDCCAARRCQSWLPTVVAGQDPLAHCQGAEGLLDGGPDVVSTGRGGQSLLTAGGGGCETESRCSCSGSCSGSCADSGRAPSEDDEQKNLASLSAASRPCSVVHRPLLLKSDNAHDDRCCEDAVSTT